MDFAKRAPMLKRPAKLLQMRMRTPRRRTAGNWCDSRVKMHVLGRALAARRENPGLFLDGSYQPLESSGEHNERVLAFARQHCDDWAIAVTPRCVAAIQAPVLGSERGKFWKDTTLTLPGEAPQKWVNVLAGKHSPPISGASRRLFLSDVFESFPVAFLLPLPS